MHGRVPFEVLARNRRVVRIALDGHQAMPANLLGVAVLAQLTAPTHQRSLSLDQEATIACGGIQDSQQRIPVFMPRDVAP